MFVFREMAGRVCFWIKVMFFTLLIFWEFIVFIMRLKYGLMIFYPIIFI